MLLLCYYRRCPHCETIKEFKKFYRSKEKKDNCSSWCKTCINKNLDGIASTRRNRVWRLFNKDKFLAAQARWREKNKDRINRKTKAYYEKNRVVMNLHMKLKARYELRNLKDNYVKQLIKKPNSEITEKDIREKREQLLEFRRYVREVCRKRYEGDRRCTCNQCLESRAAGIVQEFVYGRSEMMGPKPSPIS